MEIAGVLTTDFEWLVHKTDLHWLQIDFSRFPSAQSSVWPINLLVFRAVSRILHITHLTSPILLFPIFNPESLLLTFQSFYFHKRPSTILAINIRTALKCHNLLNFNRREMIFFQNSRLRKIYQMRPSWFLYLYSFRNKSQMNKTFAFCKCGWANLSLYIGAKHQFTIFWRLEKNSPTNFAKSKSFLCSALISKRIKIQEPGWSHLIDFSKMRILKKKSSHCD